MVSVTISRKEGKAIIQLYLFSEDKHPVVWSQRISREGYVQGIGWFTIRNKKKYKPKPVNYAQRMRKRIINLRLQYLSRQAGIKNSSCTGACTSVAQNEI